MSYPADLIDTAEACRRLGVGRSTFNRWVAAGKITPAIEGSTPRSTRFFAADDVEQMRLRLAAELEAQLAAISPAASTERVS